MEDRHVRVSSLLLISPLRLPGAFFIPYGLALFFLTFPLLVLETAVGQYTSRAGATAWRMICPMFHGEWGCEPGGGSVWLCTMLACGSNDTHTHTHKTQRFSPVCVCSLHPSGVGFASQIILAYLNIYTVVIPARILYYLYSSFHSPLPWTRCDGWYNSGELLGAEETCFCFLVGL